MSRPRDHVLLKPAVNIYLIDVEEDQKILPTANGSGLPGACQHRGYHQIAT